MSPKPVFFKLSFLKFTALDFTGCCALVRREEGRHEPDPSSRHLRCDWKMSVAL